MGIQENVGCIFPATHATVASAFSSIIGRNNNCTKLSGNSGASHGRVVRNRVSACSIAVKNPASGPSKTPYESATTRSHRDEYVVRFRLALIKTLFTCGVIFSTQCSIKYLSAISRSPLSVPPSLEPLPPASMHAVTPPGIWYRESFVI